LFALDGASTFVAMTSAVFPHAPAGRVLDSVAKNANENMAMARDIDLFMPLIKRSIEGRTEDDRIRFEIVELRANRLLFGASAAAAFVGMFTIVPSPRCALSECAPDDIKLNDDGKTLLFSRTAENGEAGLALRAI
jgi:hypothetical protein